MPDRGKKKMGAWLSALVVAALIGAYALFALVMLWMEPELLLTGFFALWLLAPLAALAGIFAALRLRLKEIDCGEEDEAAKY